jgi:hypothetical protein
MLGDQEAIICQSETDDKDELKSLCENIKGLVCSGNVGKSNLLSSKGFTNGMTIHFNMFGVLHEKQDWQQSE